MLGKFRHFVDILKRERVRFLIERNYSLVLSRLRKKIKKEKIRVVFYTNEPQKWSYESVYREFEKSSYFEPIVVVVPRYRVHIGEDSTRESLESQYAFFEGRGYRVEYGYKDGAYIDIKTFQPDIFFYLQLAEIPGVDSPFIVSRYALTAYCPYSYQLSDYRKQYLQGFHKLLYINYMEHELTLKRFESYKKGNSKNCKSVGYPKLDVYIQDNADSQNKLKSIWRDSSKFKIIYAPHRSIQKGEYNKFRWGTFQNNYELILNLAKSTPNTTWIFKPHPMLKQVAVFEGLMTKEEVDDYYNEWNRIGVLYDSGDYFDIFKSSDLMITDSASFLAEYLPSHHPLIRLVNPEGIELNELGKNLSDCYYNVTDNEEFLECFDQIVIKKNDFKKEFRKNKASTLIDFKESSAHKIYKDLLLRLKK